MTTRLKSELGPVGRDPGPLLVEFCLLPNAHCPLLRQLRAQDKFKAAGYLRSLPIADGVRESIFEAAACILFRYERRYTNSAGDPAR